MNIYGTWNGMPVFSPVSGVIVYYGYRGYGHRKYVKEAAKAAEKAERDLVQYLRYRGILKVR